MTQGLKERPGSEYSDDWKPPVNDDGLEDSYNAPSATDDNLPEGHPSRSSSPESLREAEEGGASTPGDGSASTSKELSALGSNDDKVGEGYKEDGANKPGRGKSFVGKITRKQAIIGGGGIAGIVATMGIFSILQGPLAFMHISQLLQGFHFGVLDDFGDKRTAKFMLYAASGKTAQGRLSAIGNIQANKWEARLNNKAGLRTIYGSNGRAIGYEVINPEKAKPYLKDMEVDSLTQRTFSGADIDGNTRSGVQGVFFGDRSFGERRSITRSAVRSIGLNRISSTIGSRLHIKRSGVKFSLMNPAKKRVDDRFQRRANAREQLKSDIQNGTRGSPSPRLMSIRDRLSNIRGFVSKLSGPLIVLGATCGLKSFSSAVDDQMFENNQQLIRAGMAAVTLGSEVQANNVDLDVLAVTYEYLYDEESGTSFASDPGWQYESGQDPSGTDFTQDIRPGDNSKPAIFNLADNVNPLGIGVACNTFNAIGDIGPVEAISGVINGAINAALGLAGLDSIEEYQQRALDYFAGGGGDISELAGSAWGGSRNKGTRMAANDQFIGQGGVALDNQQASGIKTASRNEQANQYANSGLFERYLNPYEPRSVVASVMQKTPKTKKQLSITIASIPKNFVAGMASLFGAQTAYAQTSEYQYSFPLFGFSLEDQNDERFDNPYENEDRLRAILEAAHNAEQSCAAAEREADRPPYPTCEAGYSSLTELNTGDSDFTSADGDSNDGVGSDYRANGQNCFSMQVNDAGSLVYGEAQDFTLIPPECSELRSEVWLRYRFYIADFVTAHSLACYEGDNSSCRQVGL